MSAVPAVTPVTVPELGSIVATEVLSLLQVPPPVISLKMVVPPLAHALNVPDIEAGIGFTLTVTPAAEVQPALEEAVTL